MSSRNIDLSNLNYRQLQAHAKYWDLPGNYKSSILIAIIKARQSGDEEKVSSIIAEQAVQRAQKKASKSSLCRSYERGMRMKSSLPRKLGRPKKVQNTSTHYEPVRLLPHPNIKQISSPVCSKNFSELSFGNEPPHSIQQLLKQMNVPNASTKSCSEHNYWPPYPNQVKCGEVIKCQENLNFSMIKQQSGGSVLCSNQLNNETPNNNDYEGNNNRLYKELDRYGFDKGTTRLPALFGDCRRQGRPLLNNNHTINNNNLDVKTDFGIASSTYLQNESSWINSVATPIALHQHIANSISLDPSMASQSSIINSNSAEFIFQDPSWNNINDQNDCPSWALQCAPYPLGRYSEEVVLPHSPNSDTLSACDESSTTTIQDAYIVSALRNNESSTVSSLAQTFSNQVAHHESQEIFGMYTPDAPVNINPEGGLLDSSFENAVSTSSLMTIYEQSQWTYECNSISAACYQSATVQNVSTVVTDVSSELSVPCEISNFLGGRPLSNISAILPTPVVANKTIYSSYLVGHID